MAEQQPLSRSQIIPLSTPSGDEEPASGTNKAAASVDAGSVDVAPLVDNGVKALLDKLTDPSFIEAMGPQSALRVSPITFQSIEQEGRWKPASLVYQGEKNQPGRAGRNFELNHQHNQQGTSPAPNTKEFYQGLTPEWWSDLTQYNQPLLTVTCQGLVAGSFTIDAIW
jgi:hypothetical protein